MLLLNLQFGLVLFTQNGCHVLSVGLLQSFQLGFLLFRGTTVGSLIVTGSSKQLESSIIGQKSKLQKHCRLAGYSHIATRHLLAQSGRRLGYNFHATSDRRNRPGHRAGVVGNELVVFRQLGIPFAFFELLLILLPHRLQIFVEFRENFHHGFGFADFVQTLRGDLVYELALSELQILHVNPRLKLCSRSIRPNGRRQAITSARSPGWFPVEEKELEYLLNPDWMMLPCHSGDLSAGRSSCLVATESAYK